MNVAALFQGYVLLDPVVDQLCLTSDGGSKLFLDGVLVINNDGNHGAITKCCNVTSGVYKVDVEYFNGYGPGSIKLEMGNPTNGLTVIPPRSWADVSEQMWSHITATNEISSLISDNLILCY